MKIAIRYFASVREALGSGETIDTQAATLAELRDELIARGDPVRFLPFAELLS